MASEQVWPPASPDHPLNQFSSALSSILESTGYNEMYGVTLSAPTDSQPTPHTTLIILQKFLRANAGDLAAAKTQLTEALKWRKEYDPLKAKDEMFDGSKFSGIGYVTKIRGAKETGNEEDVATFNIYGAAAKDSKRIFGNADEFIRWRVALMELTLSHLSLSTATKSIPDYNTPAGHDPYQALQIHDYLNVSFFRQPSEIKNSSQQIIQLFQKYYPETVSYKYFVNVPFVMQWMMGLMKGLMSKDSVRKMTWMSYGSELVNYLGPEVPKEYGGNGKALEEVGLTPKYQGESVGKKEAGQLQLAEGLAAKEEEEKRTGEPVAVDGNTAAAGAAAASADTKTVG